MQPTKSIAVMCLVYLSVSALYQFYLKDNDWVTSRPRPKPAVFQRTMTITQNVNVKNSKQNVSNSLVVGKPSLKSTDQRVGSCTNVSESNNRNKLSSKEICDQPHTNVAFLKVHKCGSTTVANLMFRFGDKHNLIVALPPKRDRPTIGRLGTIKDSDYKHPPGGKRWNIFAHHAMYDRTRFHQLMAPDTRYVTILREPLGRLQSAFKYFHLQRYFPGLEKETRRGMPPVVTYLTRPEYWDPRYRPPRRSENKEHFCFRNCMARDLGLKEKDYDNKIAVQKFVKDIENDFSTVLILQHLEESLVLLKRRMCWTFHDILYTYGRSSRKQRYNRKVPITAAMTDRFYKHNNADVMLYTRFNDLLQQDIKREGDDFLREVKYFKRVNNDVKRYCRSKKRKGQGKMVITRSRWNDAFSVDSTFCGRYGKGRKYWHPRLQSAYHSKSANEINIHYIHDQGVWIMWWEKISNELSLHQVYVGMNHRVVRR
ncbi:galactose-3-O-sulfotransferase 3-like isoform X2 [Branchiostoma floridae]|uniref:Galactose-3-O-sulfotransferase 3-like isoform X2 n=1 Tax=Branchiostoma floridae TaxID=7739 RepID=A0A9J7HWD7_BRAFL|nr:galactose-3-O-sulfotransferase 3-like isoform X2 [Branchiostoma floridae]